MSEKSNSEMRPPCLQLWVFFVFLVLKLSKLIKWSWWWVASPLWIAIIFYYLFEYYSYYHEPSSHESLRLFKKFVSHIRSWQEESGKDSNDGLGE